MPFPGPRPFKATCPTCHCTRFACMEGDVWHTPICPRCKARMEIEMLNNPLLTAVIKQVPPLRRFLRMRLSGFSKPRPDNI